MNFRKGDFGLTCYMNMACRIIAPIDRSWSAASSAAKRVVSTLFLSCLLVTAGLGAEVQLRRFDLPQATADKSLKRFSAQSGLEVIFSSQVAKGISTRPVKGEMTPEHALKTMLAGTGLIVVQEARSGAISVRKETEVEKNDQRATRATAGDRPKI
jgi:hypothetical protein